jgi:hypothetical protein
MAGFAAGSVAFVFDPGTTPGDIGGFGVVPHDVWVRRHIAATLRRGRE